LRDSTRQLTQEQGLHMNEMINKTADCKTCREHLPDLLLEPGYAQSQPELQAHLDACIECNNELNEMHATIALLDEFSAPEPSPYFDTRLHARLREAQAAAPEGFWERTRAFLTFSTGRGFRPAVSAALALVLVAGGAGIAVPLINHSNSPAAASRTVDDLNVLDNNASAEQQMGQLLDQSGAEDEDTVQSSS
jgi:hypothetical protein